LRSNIIFVYIDKPVHKGPSGQIMDPHHLKKIICRNFYNQ
jgi:hypothetical protein